MPPVPTGPGGLLFPKHFVMHVFVGCCVSIECAIDAHRTRLRWVGQIAWPIRPVQSAERGRRKGGVEFRRGLWFVVD
jgi:hypothetical protein